MVALESGRIFKRYQRRRSVARARTARLLYAQTMYLSVLKRLQ